MSHCSIYNIFSITGWIKLISNQARLFSFNINMLRSTSSPSFWKLVQPAPKYRIKFCPIHLSNASFFQTQAKEGRAPTRCGPGPPIVHSTAFTVLLRGQRRSGGGAGGSAFCPVAGHFCGPWSLITTSQKKKPRRSGASWVSPRRSRQVQSGTHLSSLAF